jgi:hypothetical protein
VIGHTDTDGQPTLTEDFTPDKLEDSFAVVFCVQNSLLNSTIKYFNVVIEFFNKLE